MFHTPASETKKHNETTRRPANTCRDSAAPSVTESAASLARQHVARLQGTYGNQAVLRTLSRATPAVQRYSASREQGIEGLGLRVDEKRGFEEISNLLAQPMVQRSTSWRAAAVHETLNLAEYVLHPDDPRTQPVTTPVLNGGEVTADSLNSPNITTSGSGRNFKAKVSRVPVQTGSADETVLSPGGWYTVATKAEVGTLLGLAACTGAGDSTLSAVGRPSHDDVYKANRRHEDQHVKDDKETFEDIIGAWDRKVERAKRDGTEFRGQTAAAAEEALWNGVGGTPQKIAIDFATLVNQKGDDFHHTAAGGHMRISNPSANADCTTSSAEVRNPS